MDDGIPKQVEFYFDIGSTYSYLAFRRLPQIAAAHGAQIVYRPMLIAGVFKATGNRSPIEVAAKARWAMTDLERWAKHYGTSFVLNPDFPINTLPLMRGATGLQMRGRDVLPYLEAMFSAMWQQQRRLGQPEEIAAVLREAGFDPEEFKAMISESAVKEELKRVTEEAVERGVFGAPTFFVDGQMYWGQDRLPFVEDALAAR